MTIRENYRLQASVIDADRLTVERLQSLPDYAPVNQEHSAASLQALERALTFAEQAERQARLAFEQARSQVIDAAWALHKSAVSARAQVIVQYGNDSMAVQAIGLKRRSDRKRPAARRRSTGE